MAYIYHHKLWQPLRKQQLKQHPLCQCCLYGGFVKAAEAVDHVIPHKQNMRLFLTKHLQSLCWSCHSSKTAMEKFGVFYDWSTGDMREWKYDLTGKVVLVRTIKKPSTSIL